MRALGASFESKIMAEKLGSTPKVLIVSNRQTTGPLWVFSLQQQQLNVVLETILANALARWEKEIPDLMILDVSLPNDITLDLIRTLRAQSLIPILFITPERSEEYVLEAYKAGIDDHMHKPVSPSLLHAKIKVWLKRSRNVSVEVLNPLKVGTLQLLPTERTVLVKNEGAIRLTNLELRLLYYLMNRPGQVVTIEELNQKVWGYASEADNTMLKNVVYRLRRKIEADPVHPLIIQTVVGKGYKLAVE